MITSTDPFFAAVFDRRPGRTGPRASAIAVFALALAYGGGLWLQLLHGLMGAHADNTPPALLQWLRDSSLMLPLVSVAVWLALCGAQRLFARAGQSSSRALSISGLAAIVGMITSAVVAASGPIRSALFSSGYTDHTTALICSLLGLSPSQSLLTTTLLGIAQDAVIGMVANLTIAGLVAAALVLRPWAALRRPRWLRSRRRYWRVAMPSLAALTLIMLPLSGGANAVAASNPGNPCPGGAQVKHFDITAIDVKIPLNRFGDNDPVGKMFVLNSMISAVRAEEASQQVSLGLRDDPIQALVIRANQGDCVEIAFTNNASGGDYGIHIDGLAYEVGSSGDAIGKNATSAVPRGGSAIYRYFIPNDETLEGAHYMRPGPGNRFAVSHGLFGALTVEPPGSTYLNANTGLPLQSGWEASIVPGSGKAFRENVQLYHEIGSEGEDVYNKKGLPLKRVDPHTDSYRPGSRAMNYRSEPFMNRLDRAPTEESHGYGSYTFGDPATPMPRSYLSDPMKFRILHAGSEMFHVFHLHGGGIRWRFNPHADHSYKYDDTGLNKNPAAQFSPSARLDSQAFGPGESYDLEIEGGSGGVQQASGEFLFHCHIAEHYVSGMWSFWRVYSTQQPDFALLPDRTPAPQAVDSAGLIGKTFNGVTITKDNLDAWIRPQLAPPGVRKNSQDAAVWDWTINNSIPNAPVYLGEPEDRGPWPDLPNLDPAHPSAYLGDIFVGNRPKLMFNPNNGRLAFPFMRTHVGIRPPFSPNGHSGAPWLGENGDQAPASAVDPFANRPDGLCPAGSPIRRFNVVAIELPIQVTKKDSDPFGKLYVLAHDKAAVLAKQLPAQPLAIRSNIGDCIAVTFTNEQTDKNASDGFSKVNMHIHHVQFDTQASDGVISGMSYEQAVRPYKVEDPQLAAAASAGATTLKLASVTKFQVGEWIGIGLGTEGIEVRQITAINSSTKTLTLNSGLAASHAQGEWAGTEFVQYRWYPDVALDNVFWHDHVDGIHTWGHGLVGQLIIEPRGSTYHDPQTGAQVDSGTIVDIHATNPLATGQVNGSFRELALWTLDENPTTDSTLNLRAEPWSDRGLDPSLRFSSYSAGDPLTPLPRAYPGDPFVIRTINVGPSVDTLHIDGHRFWLENRYVDANNLVEATPLDTIHYGISERYTLILKDGAGGTQHQPGDYLYMNGIGRRFRQGAWGIIRVLPGQAADLQPLPGFPAPGGVATLPVPTGGRPPAPTDPGNPCPAGAPQHNFNISAVDIPISGKDGNVLNKFVTAAFVPSAQAAAAQAGTFKPEPLALHVAAGECVSVAFTNLRKLDRASFHLGELLRTANSSGINIGFNSEQTIARGQTQTYRFFADKDRDQTALIADFGGDDTGTIGLYGALIIAPEGATFSSSAFGTPVDIGTQVDVHLPNGSSYRDFTVTLSDDDPIIGGSFMPYPDDVKKGPSTVNYRQVQNRALDANQFSSLKYGDPITPLLRAYAGDPVRIHVIGAPGSEQIHVFNLGGMSWALDPNLAPQVDLLQSRGIGPWEVLDAHISGGAGGTNHAVGDFFYGDLRRPFTDTGMWGLFRVLPNTCPAAGNLSLTCLGPNGS